MAAQPAKQTTRARKVVNSENTRSSTTIAAAATTKPVTRPAAAKKVTAIPGKSVPSAAATTLAGPRRVLGDLSNANKKQTDRTSKDSTASLKPTRSRPASQSSISSVSTKSKSLSAASGRAVAQHVRSASETAPGAPKVVQAPWGDPEEEVEEVLTSSQEGLGITVEDEEMVEEVQEDDPENWMMLDPNEESEAQRELDEIKREFKEELDFWDTSMVAEYSEEIFTYMAELEEKTMPDPNYMNSQTEIDWTTRATLIEWLMQVHMRYHMLPETLWISINIIDRFLSNRTVSLVKLQLVGLTAIFIAAKYEEIMAPSVEEFVFMSENGYTKDEILKGERIILQSLEFNVSPYCTPYSWVRRISKADDYDIQTRTLSKFLMEICLLDYRFIRAKPSMIAATGMYAARRMLGGDWNEAFLYYSGYTEIQLNTALQFLLEGLTAPHFEERFLYKKYSTKKFLKASLYAVNVAKTMLA